MKSKQGGASFLGWIVIAAMVSAIGLIAARVGSRVRRLPDDYSR